MNDAPRDTPTRTTRPGRPLRHAASARLDGLDAPTRHAVRRVLTLVGMLPLLFLLARQTARFPGAASLALGYGCLVMSSWLAMLYIAYSRYDDPAVRPTRRRRRDEPFPLLPAEPKVSLLLAVKDEVDHIEACVRSMAACDWPLTQIIVVDDHSGDGTPAVLRALRDELGITLISLPRNVGKKRALVRACEEADGDVLAFTDSDCLLAPDALRRCVEALVRNPNLGGVSGHCRALNATAGALARAQDVWYEGQFRIAKAAESSFGSVTCVSGPLAVFRRDAVYNYLPAWADDSFLGAAFPFATDRQLTGYVLGQAWRGRALKRRYATSAFVTGHDYPERRWDVGYVRSARVWTHVPARLGPFLRQQIRWKKSFIRNLFFTGTFMWRRGPVPAVLYYGHALWVVAAPVMVVRHLVWAPLHTLGLLSFVYLVGVALKGCVWGLAYKADHPGDTRWRYRPLMSLVSCVLLSWLLPYALLTIRRGVWSRTTTRGATARGTAGEGTARRSTV